jgi:hypothetical protein
MTLSTMVPGAGLLKVLPLRLNNLTLIRFITTRYAKAGLYGLSPSEIRVNRFQTQLEAQKAKSSYTTIYTTNKI